MSSWLRMHRVRVVLRMTAMARLQVQQSAELYALLAAANGRGGAAEPAVPEGLILDVVEQARLVLHPGDEYAFGFTYLSGSELESRARLVRLLEGLRAIGVTNFGERSDVAIPGTNADGGSESDRRPQRVVFGGNFQIARIEDLVAGRDFDPACELAAIPSEHLLAEQQRARRLTQFTIRFNSPLKAHRPKGLRLNFVAAEPADGADAPRVARPRREFMDRQWFEAPAFVRRVRARLDSLRSAPIKDSVTGRGPRGIDDPPSQAVTLANELVWLVIKYGPDFAKRHEGALGRVVLSGLSDEEIDLLVLGQYVGVGEATRFGFGRYRIEELGPDPFACRRAVSLLESVLTPKRLDQAAERYGLESGVALALQRQIARGEYQPSPCQAVRIETSGKSRLLAIPVPADRAMQRVVLDGLTPAVERLLEASSVAYRPGLGTRTAAERIRQADQAGFRWAVRADIHDFFNSVDHRELRIRLDAYLQDEPLVRLLMQWVQAGSPEPGRGLPTGAVISPMLANLLLDSFDERIEAEGARLVRYADDFLILYRSESEARRLYEVAVAAAADLKLKLNADKTEFLSLDDGFEFLGFRFSRQQEWQERSAGEPRWLDDLGWEPVGAAAIADFKVRLPGEEQRLAIAERATAILGPGIQWLGATEHSALAYSYHSGVTPSGSIPLDRLEHVLVLGVPAIHPQLPPKLSEAGVSLLLTDEQCRIVSELRPLDGGPPANLLTAQVRAAADPQRRFAIAKELVIAKLLNYATLADATPGRKADAATGSTLRQLAQSARSATSLEQLLGFEGAAAAAWFDRFSERLAGGFRFEKRVAPRAEDPVNVLLNIGHSLMHRLIVALLQAAGFAPNVGFLHQPRPGHAALASDLQEPFRHLIDRAVIDACQRFRPDDFVRAHSGPFALRIKAHVAKRYSEQLHRLFLLGCPSDQHPEPVPYRMQIARTIRYLKSFLLDDSESFTPFRHAAIRPRSNPPPTRRGKKRGS